MHVEEERKALIFLNKHKDTKSKDENDTSIYYMNYLEARETFSDLIWNFVYYSNKPYFKNAIDPNDYYQELEMSFWEAFRDYDVNRGACFSTYAFSKLRGKQSNINRWKSAKKNNKMDKVSIDSFIRNSESIKIGDMFADEEGRDPESELLSKELIVIIEENTKDSEKGLMHMLLNKNHNMISEYAKTHQMSRQNANRIFNKYREKIKPVVKVQYVDFSY
ncbi:sigma-70-like protein [Sinobaca qinghaiensis]|uniref:Sigma-70-like protein n=1 Tax=Sinobaca qinghaiensis TaxID=342944 RepID=A0A419VTV7_9BACL|nr:sigma factor [Sinobaca qinghaiensis]RKD84121.1 sigma-70-like protein [Sinobaca qinghaiensis]